jgi:beta-glucosidase
LDDYDLDLAKKTVKDADVAFVFANADSGEGDPGDRVNLSLWHNGDDLVR